MEKCGIFGKPHSDMNKEVSIPLARKEISIPMAPHIKKWICKKYEVEDVFYVSAKTVIGLTIMGLAKMKVKAHKSNDQYTETLTLSFGGDFSRNELRQCFIAMVNVYFTKLFKDEMYTHIRAVDAHGIPAYPAVQDFLKMYDIEEHEFQKTSAYTAFLRYKNRRPRPNKKKHAQKLGILS